MTSHLSQWILAALLLACLASFAWAMRAFFVQPAGATKGMRITGACGTISAILHISAIALAQRVPFGRAAAASAFYAAALTLFWWAVSTNRRKALSAIFSPDLPVHIVIEGPYRYVRHPLYSAYVMTWLAGEIATLKWWLVPTIVVMAAIYMRAAKAEEAKFLRSGLAASYDEYRSRTGRFVPAPWKIFGAKRSPEAR